MKNSDLAAKSMIIGSAAALLNIALNAVLIYGLLGAPRMEAAGAAAATAVSRGVELLWVLAEMRKKGGIRIRIKYLFYPDKTLRKDFWYYTFPVLGNELVWGGGFTMYSVIMGHLGTDAVAANSIANIVKNIILDEIVKLPAVYRRYRKYIWLKDLTIDTEQAAGASRAASAPD